MVYWDGFSAKMTKTIFLIFQIIFAVLLSGLILLQAKGSGLGNPLGKLNLYSTKRGVEKLIFNLTIAVAVLFFLSSLAQLLI